MFRVTCGWVLLQVRTQTQKINAKTAKKLKGRISGITAGTSGLSSSLAFTPIQVTIIFYALEELAKQGNILTHF